MPIGILCYFQELYKGVQSNFVWDRSDILTEKLQKVIMRPAG